MEIIQVREFEIEKAMSLVWQVFLEFEAPDYSKEGVDTFHDFISDKRTKNTLRIYGAYINDNIVGIIATKNEGNHIALLFVDGRCHRQGIGRKLFELILKESTSDIITVNSSPFALEFYRRLGFVNTNRELTIKGIRFTPMKYEK